MNQKYFVLHSHRHGQSNYIVECSHYPSEEEVIEHCNIDFEPLKEETIEISEMHDGDVIKIP